MFGTSGTDGCLRNCVHLPRQYFKKAFLVQFDQPDRRLGLSDNKFILPAAMAFGAFFLLFCDIISRSLDLGATIPIGVVTSFIGAPIFMLLIIMQKKAVW